MDDKNILKENEEKEIVIENFSDFEESEEYVSNYLTKLKSLLNLNFFLLLVFINYLLTIK